MTSLSKQLESLRTATSRQLTVEKKHVSLLFDRQEAEKLDRETIFKIGCTGFTQLKQLDCSLDSCSEFFDESILNFQRTTISKEENDSLSKRLEAFIYKISPYLLHFPCQQVLEWLINRYQVHAYNAEFMIVAFLPFHDTNLFGRLLSILEFNFSLSKDWSFFKEFRKSKQRVPFHHVAKNALSNNYSMIGRISDHIEKGVQIAGQEFMEIKASLLYTFYAKLLISMLDLSKTTDEHLISKMMPVIGNGLRSSIAPFQNASLMILCQLSHSVQLSSYINKSIIKILLLKLKESTLINTLSTLVVVCQTQQIDEFPRKAILKFVKRAESIGTWAVIDSLSTQTDLLQFLNYFWISIFSILRDDAINEDDRLTVCRSLQKTVQRDNLSSGQATLFLSQLLSSLSSGLCNLPLSIVKEVQTICLRHSTEWNSIVSEWKSRDKIFIEKFVKDFQLENLVVISSDIEKRDRKRTLSLRNLSPHPQEEKQTPAERAYVMAMSSGFAKQQKFQGDPMKKTVEWISACKIEEILWALGEITRRKSYFSNQLEDDVEEFAVILIKFALEKRSKVMIMVKSAISKMSFRAQFATALLVRYEPSGSSAKKSKGLEQMLISKTFEEESEENYWNRVLLVLEVLSMTSQLQIDSKLFHTMFDILKDANSVQSGELRQSVQHFVIAVLLKMVSGAEKYKFSSRDIQMEVVVETMRSTQSHHIFRECLKLLTAVVRLNPSSITSHIMSVFTFMGSGLLRKDNDLTLGIIERTVEALFSAVIQTGQKHKADVATKLIAIAKVFSSAAPDIPAHRRARMAQALSRAIGVEYIWIVVCVMVEGFCAKWQRVDQSKKNTEQDACEDIVLELCVARSSTEQLYVILDLIEYVVRLGGDTVLSNKLDHIDVAIFDRTKFTVQKLRHFRFFIIGVCVKILSSRILLEKLSQCSDEMLYASILPIGKTLLTASVKLDEFGITESEAAEKSQDSQTLRYWVALQTRSDAVADKLRYLLPGGVAANVICDILEDENTNGKMREKVLQLANMKLLTDGFFYSDSGINEAHLNRLASVLNKWIIANRANVYKIDLCKNATFTLKLIAKRIPKQSESAVLTETMEKVLELVQQWETLDDTMVGNALFLSGELIRSHNMRCTMASCEPLLKVCLGIISEFLSTFHQTKKDEEVQSRRQRVRQQSLSGKKLGSDALLIAALTCLQRILDHFAPFISTYIGDILVKFCLLSGRFPINDVKSAPVKGTVCYRLNLIRLALSTMEFRMLSNHFSYAVKQVKEEKALCSLMMLLVSYFHQKNRHNIIPIRLTLLNDVLLPAFEYRTVGCKPENFENIAKTEKCIFHACLKMADVLTDSELRPVVSKIVQWAEPALSKKEHNHDIRVRLVVLFHFANEFYKYFNHLAMPHFGKLLELAPQILTGCNASQIADSSLLFLSGKKNTIEGLETDFLLRQTIIFIGNCGRHREFLSQNIIGSLSSALVEELVNTRVAGHESRCVPHLAEALYRICDSSPDSFPEILNKVLLKTRNSHPKIRFRSLLVIEALVERIGDALAPQLPMLMPFLSELFEDENKKVENQCERVIRSLQKKFGENISEGFA